MHEIHIRGVSWSDEENPARLCKSAHGAASIFRCENKSLDHARRVASRQLEIDTTAWNLREKNSKNFPTHVMCGVLSTHLAIYSIPPQKNLRVPLSKSSGGNATRILFTVLSYIAGNSCSTQVDRRSRRPCDRKQPTSNGNLHKFRFVFASKIRWRPRNLEQQQRALPSRTRDRTIEE